MKRTTMLLLFLMCFAAFIPKMVFASDGPVSLAENQSWKTSVASQELDRSINEVLKKREYSWRMPREKPDRSKSKGFLAKTIDDLFDMLRNWIKTIIEWIERFLKWIIEQLERLFNIRSRTRTLLDAEWIRTTNILLYVLLCVVSCALVLMIWRMWRKRGKQKSKATVAEEFKTPDISDDNVVADELPTSIWLKTAQELMEQGNLRLALRAFYLASLSYLSQHEMIKIARFKSNRDYEKELGRKAHAIPDLLSAFSDNVRIFESIWYGMHEVTSDIVDNFHENQKRIMILAEKY